MYSIFGKNIKLLFLPTESQYQHYRHTQMSDEQQRIITLTIRTI